MIRARGLSLTYPNGRGVFDLNFTVGEGEVVGYLGPNGAGKTTTIRALVGFMRPDAGDCAIGGLDCAAQAPRIQRSLGYIPGEISFLDGMSGGEFLRFMRDMRRMADEGRQRRLLEMFELDPRGKIKRFSKGMKQKLGIVAAFMHDPAVYILDEPTSGLDPLMQSRFVDLIREEKKRAKTILMSSHMFEEVERTCDKALIIKQGRIVEQSGIGELKNTRRKGFVITPGDISAAAAALEAANINFRRLGDTLEADVAGGETDRFIKTLARVDVLGLDVRTQTLEDVFMHHYGKEEGGI
jgi:ABC-2 type transport system ATP-binding protein